MTKRIELEVNENTKYTYEQTMKEDEKKLAELLADSLRFIEDADSILMIIIKECATLLIGLIGPTRP